eukprot:4239350-Amphidinium_carterae.2
MSRTGTCGGWPERYRFVEEVSPDVAALPTAGGRCDVDASGDIGHVRTGEGVASAWLKPMKEPCACLGGVALVPAGVAVHGGWNCGC